MDNKMENISERLLGLGYKKQVFKNPNSGDLIQQQNHEEFLRKLTKELGNAEMAADFVDLCQKAILKDFIPEMSFEGNGFEIGFFTDKGILKIDAIGEKRLVENECTIVTQEVFQYKEMNIENFYRLLIEKNTGIGFILGSGDN